MSDEGIVMPPGALVTGDDPECETCKKLIAVRDSIAEGLDKMARRTAAVEMMLSTIQMDLRVMRPHLHSPFGQGVAEMIESIDKTLHPKLQADSASKRYEDYIILAKSPKSP
jgi:hypothetical protein